MNDPTADPTADPPDWCAECGRQQLASCWMLTARAVLCDECAARLRWHLDEARQLAGIVGLSLEQLRFAVGGVS